MRLPVKVIALLSLILASCTGDPYRGVYEGIRSRNEGLKTPAERETTTPAPSYDRYKKEREQQDDPAAGTRSTP